MKLELVTLLGTKLDTDVYEVILPTLDGEIAIFPGHEPLVGVATPGAIVVRHKKGDDDKHLDFFAISGGVIQVSPNTVRVLVDEADSGDDISEAEAKSALDKALSHKKNAKDSVELEKASAMVDRHAVRLKVAGLRRRNRR